MLQFYQVGEKMNKVKIKNFHAEFYQELISLINNKDIPHLIRTYQKDQIIASSGSICYSVGIIIKGMANIEQITASGEKNLINSLKQYDIFGEILLFTDSPYYPYEIIAVNYCEILFITKLNLLKIFKEDIILLEKFLAHISQSYKKLNLLIKLKSQKNIISKLAYYFIYFSDISENNLNCHIASKTQLAEIIGIERQSLIRVLNQLRDKGCLSYDRHNIYLKNVAYFKQLIE